MEIDTGTRPEPAAAAAVQSPAVEAPPHHKLVLLTILGAYPALLGYSALLGFLLPSWPKPVTMLIIVIFMVPTITYIIQPLLKKIFHAWLYPPVRPK